MVKTQIFDLKDKNIYEEAMTAAADAIRAGKTVVFPTETVYGIGANAYDNEAVRKIFEAKGRPSDNPLIIHLADPAQIHEAVSCMPEEALRLAEKFMPGALTLVLEKNPKIADAACAGLNTAAVRIPDNEYARELIRRAGVPVAAPSANISGKPSPTKPEHAVHDMDSRADVILLGDSCRIGLESTIIDCTVSPFVLLRPGGISTESLSEHAKIIQSPQTDSGQPKAPGMKYAHYKPDAYLAALDADAQSCINYINERETEDSCSAALLFDEYSGAAKIKHEMLLGNFSDTESSASRLFDLLRKCDELNIEKIYVMCPPDTGLGRAFRNRLFKAADEIVGAEQMKAGKQNR